MVEVNGAYNNGRYKKNVVEKFACSVQCESFCHAKMTGWPDRQTWLIVHIHDTHIYHSSETKLAQKISHSHTTVNLNKSQGHANWNQNAEFNAVDQWTDL